MEKKQYTEAAFECLFVRFPQSRVPKVAKLWLPTHSVCDETENLRELCKLQKLSSQIVTKSSTRNWGLTEACIHRHNTNSEDTDEAWNNNTTSSSYEVW